MDIFYALAEPTRRDILELLAKRGRLAASDIYKKFDVTHPAISQHLKVLREAKLVDVKKQAQHRIYQINPKKISELEVWVKHMKQQWDQRFDRLDKVLETEKTRLRSSLKNSGEARRGVKKHGR